MLHIFAFTSQDYDSEDDTSDGADRGEAGRGRGEEARAAAEQRASSAPLPPLVAAKKGGPLATRDPVRDRPLSAHRFKELSVNDNETKVCCEIVHKNNTYFLFY